MLLQGSETANGLQIIWDDFIDLIKELKKDYTTEESISEIKSRIDSWFQKFLHVYQAKDVTPYMHALRNHVPEFLKLCIQEY